MKLICTDRLTSSHRGMSLIELLLAVFLSSVVVLGSMQLLTNAKVVDQDSDLQALIDQKQGLALQIARSPRIVKEILEISDEDPCFNRRPGAKDVPASCTTQTNWTEMRYLKNNKEGIDKILHDNVSVNGGACSGNSQPCAVSVRVEYRRVCPPKTICSLEIRAETKPLVANKKGRFKARQATVTLNGLFLASRKKINFDCTNTGHVSNIDYENLDSNCEEISGVVESPQDLPLRTFASSSLAEQSGVQANCNLGIGGVGIFRGQEACTAPQTNPVSNPTPTPTVIVDPGAPTTPTGNSSIPNGGNQAGDPAGCPVTREVPCFSLVGASGQGCGITVCADSPPPGYLCNHYSGSGYDEPSSWSQLAGTSTICVNQ